VRGARRGALAHALERASRPAACAPLLLALWLGLGLADAPIALPPNDEGALLTNAARLLRGAVYYRDLDAYPLPGATHLLALAFGLFGERVAVARGLALGVSSAALLALYAAALAVLERRRAALFGLSLLAFKFLAWPGFAAYFYSDLAFAAGAGALALFLRRPAGGARPGRLALVGLLAGLALCSKQSLGIPLVAALAALLLRAAPAPGTAPRGRAPGLAAFGLGAALPLAALAFDAARHGALGALAESAFLRPFWGYWPASRISFLPPLAWWSPGALREVPGHPYLPGAYLLVLLGGKLPGGAEGRAAWLAGELFARVLYSSLPLIFLGALLRLARRRGAGAPQGAEGRLGELALLALAFALSAFPRADHFHVIGIYPVVLLLLAALTSERGAARGRPPWPGAAAVALLLVTTGWLGHLHRGLYTHRLELERGRLWVSPWAAWAESVVRFAREEVGQGAPLFVYGHEAWVYFLADRYPPWPFAQLYPGQAGDDGGRALVARLEREPPALIVRGDAGIPSLPGYTPQLARWVRERYEPDPRVFERHPPRAGGLPPPSLALVLRPRAAGPRSAGEARELGRGVGPPGQGPADRVAQPDRGALHAGEGEGRGGAGGQEHGAHEEGGSQGAQGPADGARGQDQDRVVEQVEAVGDPSPEDEGAGLEQAPHAGEVEGGAEEQRPAGGGDGEPRGGKAEARREDQVEHEGRREEEEARGEKARLEQGRGPGQPAREALALLEEGDPQREVERVVEEARQPSAVEEREGREREEQAPVRSAREPEHQRQEEGEVHLHGEGPGGAELVLGGTRVEEVGQQLRKREVNARAPDQVGGEPSPGAARVVEEAREPGGGQGEGVGRVDAEDAPHVELRQLHRAPRPVRRARQTEAAQDEEEVHRSVAVDEEGERAPAHGRREGRGLGQAVPAVAHQDDRRRQVAQAVQGLHVLEALRGGHGGGLAKRARLDEDPRQRPGEGRRVALVQVLPVG